MDYKNFLEAFDIMMKNADGAVKVSLTAQRGRGCGEPQQPDGRPKVFLENGYVHWFIVEGEDFTTLTENLLKVEGLIDEANKIRRYEKQMALNHPDVFKALRARLLNFDC